MPDIRRTINSVIFNFKSARNLRQKWNSIPLVVKKQKHPVEEMLFKFKLFGG
jgi:hypothetical protein